LQDMCQLISKSLLFFKCMVISHNQLLQMCHNFTLVIAWATIRILQTQKMCQQVGIAFVILSSCRAAMCQNMRGRDEQLIPCRPARPPSRCSCGPVVASAPSARRSG
jgi:hypothetical protein